jgi:ATP-binding cassette subfamily F protein 3
MAVITLSNIKKAFGTRELFEEVSFHINERERVALIGANGSGKTTLLRIICGESEADSGSVSMEPGISIGYLPQEVDLPEEASLHLAVMGVTPELLACAVELTEVERRMHEAHGEEAHRLGNHYAELSHKFDTLGGFDFQMQARAILLGLGFDESEFEKSVRSLSGGQKTRAALARLLLAAPDVLLLDEPTNHLDIQACDWLQSFLEDRFKGAALIVSHDRYFLDHVVSKVVEIEAGEAVSYPGNYSSFANQKSERLEEQRKLYKMQQKEIARIESAIQTLFSDRKFSRRDNKIKQLERIQRLGNVSERRTIKASLSPAARSGRDVVTISGLSKSYPGKTLFSELDFLVERGQKIGIVGPNGSGKTTLLKILAERIDADGGEFEFGHKVEPVYFAQEFDHLSPTRTVLEELLADSDITSGQARDMLAQFLFMGDDAFKKVEVLSGGEMCRLALAKVLASAPNLLLLDEPTNHLDIQSREALEEALQKFDGTVLVASHDRYLLDAITGGILEIKDGGAKYFLGNYSYYREQVAPAPEPVPTFTPRRAVPEPPKRRPDSPLKALQRELREYEKERTQLESSIESTEARMGELTEALADEESYKNGSAKELSEEYHALQARLEELYTRWETVCHEISRVESDIAELIVR